MAVTYDRANARDFTVLASRSQANGRSEVLIRCPFDSTEFWARNWSLGGGGKKCPTCGAKHGSTGLATPEIKP